MAKGRVSFLIDVCKGCELCTVVCPEGIVVMDKAVLNRNGYHPAAVMEMERCVACGNCARFCPDSVISVERLD